MEYEAIPREKIVNKLRQTLEPKGVSAAFSSAAVSSNLDNEDEDLALLKTGFDIYNIPISSYQKFFGSAVVRLRKFVRKLLRPVLERQVIYNFTNARVVQRLSQQLTVLQSRQAVIEKEIEGSFSEQFSELKMLVQSQAEVLASLQAELESVKQVQAAQMAFFERVFSENEVMKHPETKQE